MISSTIKEKQKKEMASKLKTDGMRCNCDLDNWEPEQSTGHPLYVAFINQLLSSLDKNA